MTAVVTINDQLIINTLHVTTAMSVYNKKTYFIRTYQYGLVERISYTS